MRVGERFNPYKRFRQGSWIPESLSRNRQLSPGAKLAWGRLSRFAGEDGVCNPSAARLAREIGVKERQARTYISQLVRIGLISRNSQTGKATTYHFLWHQILEGEPEPRQDAAEVPRKETAEVLDERRQDTACQPRQDASADPGRILQQKRSTKEESKQASQQPNSRYALTIEKLREWGADDQLIAGVLDRCTGYDDQQIVSAIEWKSHQKSPALFLYTVPENLARQRACTEVLSQRSGTPVESVEWSAADIRMLVKPYREHPEVFDEPHWQTLRETLKEGATKGGEVAVQCAAELERLAGESTNGHS